MKKYQWLFIIISLLTANSIIAEIQEIQLLENSNTPIIRVIIKQSENGHYFVQDFYRYEQKHSEPVLLNNSYRIDTIIYNHLNVENNFILWHSNQEKWQRGHYAQVK